MRKFIGIIATLAVLGVVVMAILNRGNYRSMMGSKDEAGKSNMEVVHIEETDTVSMPIEDNLTVELAE